MSLSEKRKKAKEAVLIPPHTHCKVCGRAIPEGQIYCSKECRDKDLNRSKRDKRMMWGFYGAFMVILVVMLVVAYAFK